MKLILIHGSLQELVSRKSQEIKKGFDPLSVVELSENPDALISSAGLFSEKRLIILQNPDIKIIEKIIQKSDPEETVLIRFSKTLEKSSPVLKKLIEEKSEIYLFEESSETSIFPLLDLIGNLKPSAFKELEKNYDEFSGQYIVTMLAYFLRRMVARPKSGGSDFMRQKIEAQKRNFPLKKIAESYRELIETDYKVKQGLIDEKTGVYLLIQKFIGKE